MPLQQFTIVLVPRLPESHDDSDEVIANVSWKKQIDMAMIKSISKKTTKGIKFISSNIALIYRSIITIFEFLINFHRPHQCHYFCHFSHERRLMLRSLQGCQEGHPMPTSVHRKLQDVPKNQSSFHRHRG